MEISRSAGISAKLKKFPSSPGMVEILGIYLITFFISFFCLHFFKGLFPDKLRALVSIGSHIPMLVIPWLWYHFRVCSSIKTASLWRWNKRSLKYLLIMCSWLIPLQILGSLDAVGKAMPLWYQHGTASIVLHLLFQGLIVGFTEEMLMRPVIHQTLLSKQFGGFLLFGKIYVSTPTVVTALLFGFMHAGNIGHQPIGYTILQVVYAFIIGIILGIYYERTRSYIGTAILHNLLDVTGVIVVLVVALLQ